MLRFFATNRAMDRLGRAVGQGGRSDRHKLSRGGYYFVDMEDYMRFYLGEVDDNKMPAGAVLKDSQGSVFGKFLSDPRIGSVVVCVHGFNVELFEASTWFRILTDTMKNLPDIGKRVVTSPADLTAENTAEPGSLTAFIGFSWPSNGSVLSYTSDQREAIALESGLRLSARTAQGDQQICQPALPLHGEFPRLPYVRRLGEQAHRAVRRS